MGANVGFIAFRDAPDLAKLAAVPGLSGFRLFKHNSKPEWYLEGPSSEGSAITFFEPLDYDPNGDAFKQAQADAAAVANEFRLNKLNVEGLDERALAEALTLHHELRIPTLLVYSNDEGIDAGLICSDGAVAFAKLPTRQREMAIYENGKVRVEPPLPDEFDEGEPVLDQHQFATEVANAFFGTSTRWRVTSDPFEFDAADFTVSAASGRRAPIRFPGDDIKDALWAIESGTASDAEKLRQCLRVMDTCVAATTDPNLITATRVEVDHADFQILACAVHADRRRYDDPKYAALSAFFGELAQYLRRLKPKPDFRHDMDFRAEGRRLLTAWRALAERLSA